MRRTPPVSLQVSHGLGVVSRGELDQTTKMAVTFGDGLGETETRGLRPELRWVFGTSARRAPEDGGLWVSIGLRMSTRGAACRA